MISLELELKQARPTGRLRTAQHIAINKDSLTVVLIDGRTITVPLMWYPRLWYGTPEERNHFELIADGELIHWPDLDEDLSISGILAGRRSGESAKSLKRWLSSRTKEEAPTKLPTIQPFALAS